MQFRAEGVRLTDVEAARVLVAIDSIPIRDKLWTDMNRVNVSSHVALWTDMTRRDPNEVRAAAASLLGFASWLSGHGAMAWCALDQVPKDRPYPLAGLVASAVQSGMHPREWEGADSQRAEDSFETSSAFMTPQPTIRPGEARPALGF